MKKSTTLLFFWALAIFANIVLFAPVKPEMMAMDWVAADIANLTLAAVAAPLSSIILQEIFCFFMGIFCRIEEDEK